MNHHACSMLFSGMLFSGIYQGHILSLQAVTYWTYSLNACRMWRFNYENDNYCIRIHHLGTIKIHVFVRSTKSKETFWESCFSRPFSLCNIPLISVYWFFFCAVNSFILTAKNPDPPHFMHQLCFKAIEHLRYLWKKNNDHKLYTYKTRWSFIILLYNMSLFVRNLSS